VAARGARAAGGDAAQAFSHLALIEAAARMIVPTLAHF